MPDSDLKHQYHFIGNQDLLKRFPIAVFCSKEIPISIYHTANETFKELLRLPLTLAGGWQSPMEKKILKDYDSDGQASIIYFLAKGIQRFIIPKYLNHLLGDGKLIIISPFLNERRITKDLVMKRDNLILTTVKRFLFLYIKPEGYLEQFFKHCIAKNKEVYLLQHQANKKYFIEGVNPLRTGELLGK